MVKVDLNEVIYQAQHGDQYACTTLYNKLLPIVKKTIRTKIFGIDKFSIDDISQDIFIKLFQRLYTYFPGRGVEAWAYTITVNHCIDLSRKKIPSITYHGNDSELHLLSSNWEQESPEETFIRKEGRMDMEEFAYSNLPEKKRVIVKEKYFAGMKQREIAVKLNKPTGTISSLNHASIEILRKEANRLNLSSSNFL